MTIDEVFVFADGRTVFVGTTHRPVKGVPNGAELVVAGAVVARFRVNVELPLHPAKGSHYCVSTSEVLPLDPKELKKCVSLLVLYLTATTTELSPS